MAAGVAVEVLIVRRPVDVALVATVASLMRRVVALPVEALRITKLRHQARARRNTVGLRLARTVPSVIACQLHHVFPPLLVHILPVCLKQRQQRAGLDLAHLDHRVRVAQNERRPTIGPLPFKGGGHHLSREACLHVHDAHIIILVVPAVAHGHVPVPALHNCCPDTHGNAGRHVLKVNEALEYLVLLPGTACPTPVPA